MSARHNLRNIPFFSDLGDDVLDAISRRLQREHYHKNTTIFFEDAPGDCMYIIESGQVKVVSEKEGREKIFGYFGPGNFFGEMALLLGEKRSATARVVIDADLLVLYKQDLEMLLNQYPSLAMMMTRELGRRLEHADREPETKEAFNLVAVLGSAAPMLARRLAQVTGEQVCLYDLGGLANVTLDLAALARAGVVLLHERHAPSAEELPARLGNLVEQFYWVLLSVAPYEAPRTLKAMELADATVQFGAEEYAWIQPFASKAFWRSASGDVSICRTARRIAQRQVGLALSSGNARGFAHIGTLQVLQEEGIPIDMIAATSAGAVIGALFAAGRTIPELVDFAAHVRRQYNFFTGFRYWDFRLPPRSGLIKGDMILKYFRRWLLDKTFDDLAIPLYIVATDLISGEEVVFDHGSVAEAVRASMSVIGVLEPARVSGRYLIDGGSVNPVPTQLLADKGVSIILASNVIPSLADRLHRRELRREGKLPNVMGIMMGAMEIMESEIIKTRMGPVDILIQPDVARYGTFDYEKANELIQRGAEATRAQIPAIKQLIAPRPRQSRRG